MFVESLFNGYVGNILNHTLLLKLKFESNISKPLNITIKIIMACASIGFPA